MVRRNQNMSVFGVLTYKLTPKNPF